MTPVWRLHNGRGPSWQYGQAQVTTETSFQVVFCAEKLSYWYWYCGVFICVCRLSSKASGATIVPAASLLLMMSHSTMGWVWWFQNRSSINLQVCSTIPEPALIIKGECTFDRDACGWRNTTTVSLNFIQKSLRTDNLGWQLWQLKIISKNTI